MEAMGAMADLEPQMRRAAEVFVATSSDAGADYVFDFSAASVKQLDRMIARDWPPGEKPSDEVVAVMGAYLGEVLVRTLGGRWTQASPADEPGVLLGEGGLAFPMSKVRKRVDLGKTHSVGHFYAELHAFVGGSSRSS